MNPVIFEFGPIVVRWYGVMMALTILTSIVFATRWGPRFGMERAFIDRITFWLAIVLFAGARVGYVVSHPWEFRDPLEIFRLWHGGLTSHGAIAAGLLYGYLLARRAGVSFWSLADTIAWAIPLGNIFPPVPDAPRHPLQLYEMILAVIVLVIAWQVARRRAFPGQVWWMIVVLTSSGRIFLDALRSEEHDILGIIAYGQIAAVILLVVVR